MVIEKQITSKKSFARRFLGLIPIGLSHHEKIDMSDILGEDFFVFKYANNYYIAKHHSEYIEYAKITKIYNERINHV